MSSSPASVPDHEDVPGRDAAEPSASWTAHAHLWQLPDGTGLHVPRGELRRESGTGQAYCHLCGKAYESLGSHVRAHGHTAASYREAMGLCVGLPLTTPRLSDAISRRQAAAYRSDPAFRARLELGQALVDTGELAELARQARDVDGDRPQRTALQRQAGRRGRTTTHRTRDERRQEVLDAHGADSLHDYLRHAYDVGASLDSLGRELGLGRAALRAELAAAGVSVRPPGRNTPAGKRSRARRAEERAAERVGTDDLHRWLSGRAAAGWTLTELAEAVGHSTHWVRWRLDAADDAVGRDDGPAESSRNG